MGMAWTLCGNPVPQKGTSVLKLVMPFSECWLQVFSQAVDINGLRLIMLLQSIRLSITWSIGFCSFAGYWQLVSSSWPLYILNWYYLWNKKNMPDELLPHLICHHRVPWHRSCWELHSDDGRKLGNCVIIKNTFVSGKSVGGGRCY